VRDHVDGAEVPKPAEERERPMNRKERRALEAAKRAGRVDGKRAVTFVTGEAKDLKSDTRSTARGGPLSPRSR
jgi:hypothetical protein